MLFGFRKQAHPFVRKAEFWLSIANLASTTRDSSETVELVSDSESKTG